MFLTGVRVREKLLTTGDTEDTEKGKSTEGHGFSDRAFLFG